MAGRGSAPVKGLAGYVVAVAAVLLVATWGGGSPTCPAIGWGSELRVELDDRWPGAQTVRIECSSRCGLAVDPVDDGPDAAILPLSGSTASVPFLLGAPDTVTVTVLGVGGAVLTEAVLDLAWERVGGSAECGGPQEATARVP